MSTEPERVVQAAITAGILPPGSALPTTDARPWPVVLLTALGAWLAALPLMGVVGLLLGDFVSGSVGPYASGVLLLAGATVVLRSRTLPVFVEQLALPALLVGGGALGFGLFRDLASVLAALLLAMLAIGLGFAIARSWLRLLLGATAAALATLALVPVQLLEGRGDPWATLWTALHAVLAIWAAALALQHRVWNDGARAAKAQALEALAAGWALALLAGLAWFAGMSFLIGATLGAGLVGAVARELGPHAGLNWATAVLQAASVGLGLLAALRAARAWPGLRQPLVGCVAAVLLVLCWFLASLGAVLLVLAITATTGRRMQAAAAATAAAWILGSFYYALQWPLGQKAVLLVFAGAALGALAWLARRSMQRIGSPAAGGAVAATAGAGAATAAAPGAGAGAGAGAAAKGVAPPAPSARSWAARAPALLALGAAATLAVANGAIWQKESIIARGQPLFVRLAPVDPRSLMQGDYMRLNFAVPAALEKDLSSLVTRKRPHVIARRDERGVATLLRLAGDDAALAPGELRIELTPKGGDWIFVTDAWFFGEGDAARWEQARYGEFRVLPGGAALLVGMADEQLRPIGR